MSRVPVFLRYEVISLIDQSTDYLFYFFFSKFACIFIPSQYIILSLFSPADDDRTAPPSYYAIELLHNGIVTITSTSRYKYLDIGMLLPKPSKELVFRDTLAVVDRPSESDISVLMSERTADRSEPVNAKYIKMKKKSQTSKSFPFPRFDLNK